MDDDDDDDDDDDEKLTMRPTDALYMQMKLWNW